MIDGSAFQRIGLALKVLDSTYDHKLRVTPEDIETLKSYLDGDGSHLKIDGDASEVKIEDIAVAVIQQELRRERLSRDGAKSSTNGADSPPGKRLDGS